MRFAALAFALALPACAIAQPDLAAASAEASQWRAVDAETGKIRDIKGLEQLAREFPDSGSVRLRLLQPYLAAGEMEKVMETLEWLYDRGYVFSEVSQTQIPKLMEGVDPGRIAERLRAEAEVIATSEIIATVPAEAGLVESVLMDLENGHLAVTSVTGKRLWSHDLDDNWIDFPLDNADNLSGIAYQPGLGRIWVSSGNIDGSERDASAFSGLISPGIGNSELRVTAPDGVSLSDLHISDNGTVYASDPLNGGIYLKRPDSEEMQTLVAPGTLRSPQGLASSSDGKRLYVSDYRYGIAIIDVATGTVSRLASDIPVILDGVDAMWRREDELIGVQNGTSPMRISAFKLSADGNRVISSRVLEQANPEWTEPLSGYHGRDALYYIGNGQWDRYVDGVPAQDKPPLPTQIRRLPLD